MMHLPVLLVILPLLRVSSEELRKDTERVVDPKPSFETGAKTSVLNIAAALARSGANIHGRALPGFYENAETPSKQSPKAEQAPAAKARKSVLDIAAALERSGANVSGRAIPGFYEGNHPEEQSNVQIKRNPPVQTSTSVQPNKGRPPMPVQHNVNVQTIPKPRQSVSPPKTGSLVGNSGNVQPNNGPAEPVQIQTSPQPQHSNLPMQKSAQSNEGGSLAPVQPQLKAQLCSAQFGNDAHEPVQQSNDLEPVGGRTPAFQSPSKDNYDEAKPHENKEKSPQKRPWWRFLCIPD